MSKNQKTEKEEVNKKKDKIKDSDDNAEKNSENSTETVEAEKVSDKADDVEESPLQKLQEELKNKKDAFMRLAAEYENFRKRSSKEKDAIYKDATAKSIETLLPVLDSLEFAVKSAQTAPDEYKKGLELMKAQFDKAFETLGVSAFGVAGDEFDPNIHNAVSHIDDESIADNTIVEVFQTGYRIDDRIVRHAMVKVAN